MIVPTHRRPNGLDAELDALVAREVDALALRKARVPNGKAAHDQVAEDQAAAEPPMQDEDVRPDPGAGRRDREVGAVGKRMPSARARRRGQILVDVEKRGAGDVAGEVELATARRVGDVPAAVREPVAHL